MSQIPIGSFFCMLIPLAAASAQSSLPVLALKPDLRIDANANNLSGISWVGISPKGTIAILQPEDKRVVFFNEAGRLIGTFGQAGAGPGEFRQTANMGWVGDTLWVRDIGLRRTTFISPQFKLVRDVAFPPDPLSQPGEGSPCQVRYRDGSTVSNPYCAVTIKWASPDSSRIAIVRQTNPTSTLGQFTVTVVKHGGDTVFSRPLTAPAIAIPKHWADSILDANSRRMAPEHAADYRSLMPSTFAPVRRVIPGSDGTTWVMLWGDPTTTPRHYIVLGPTGTPLGSVVLPKNVDVHVVSHGVMWGVETDADGMETVVRYRVP